MSFLVPVKTANAQIWISSGFTVTPGSQNVTAYSSTSAVNPTTGQASQAASDYHQFTSNFLLSTSTTPTQYISSPSCGVASPAEQCSLTFQPQPGVTYTIHATHSLVFYPSWYFNGSPDPNCPQGFPTYGACWSDPEGFYEYPWVNKPLYSTQGTSITQEVTGSETGTGVSQIIPSDVEVSPGQFVSQGAIFPFASSSAVYTSACPFPTITSLLPKTWFAGKSYPITITGTGFITQANATAACPENQVFAETGTGSAGLSNVTVVSPTLITATVTPDTNDPTENAAIEVKGTSGVENYGIGIRTQILGNQIQWTQNGVTNTISTTDGSTPPTQNAVVGQQIALTTTTPTTTSYDGPTLNPIWTVGGTNIGGYTASTAGASVTPTTLNQTGLTTYFVYPGSAIPVTYQYCVNIQGANPVLQCSIANATFNVTGPTGGSMSFTPYSPSVSIANLTACTDSSGVIWNAGPYLVYAQDYVGPACPGQGFMGAFGISFNSPTGYQNSAGGSFFLVQLIGSDVVTGGCCTQPAGLDTRYPYGSPPSNDNPGTYLPPTINSASRTFTANMFLMWQSSTTGSIAVPLGYQNWGFSGTATCSAACGVASSWTATTNGTPGPIGSFVLSSPSQTQTNDGNNVLMDGYPTWTVLSY